MWQKRTALTCPEILAVIAILLVIVSFFLPNVDVARTNVRRNGCMANLKQISIALLTYEEEHGEFPPAYTVNDEGNRLHSWRTLLLPYLEQQQLFDTIDLTKPWDDPVNLKAREAVVKVFVCPSSDVKEGMTTYLGVVGPDCFFSGAKPRKTTDCTDDWGDTIIVIEVPQGQAVPWMSPHDVDKDTVLKMNSASKMSHPHGVFAGCLDGHARSISVDVDVDVDMDVDMDMDMDKGKLGAMLTINGGEKIED